MFLKFICLQIMLATKVIKWEVLSITKYKHENTESLEQL